MTDPIHHSLFSRSQVARMGDDAVVWPAWVPRWLTIAGIGLFSSACGLTDSVAISPPQTIPANPPKGEALAHVYCESCHLFPSPDLLDKRTWANGALRKMAPLLGVAHLNLENRADGKFLAEANLFPPSPILAEADWQAIVRYYLDSAPENALPQGSRLPISTNLDLFRAEPLTDSHFTPGTTLVRIDAVEHRLLLGDARQKQLHFADSDGRWQKSVPVASAPVALANDGQTLYVSLIGNVFPTDEKSGRLVAFTPTTAGGYESSPVLADLKRPTDCIAVDLNADGRKDLVVTQFGNYLGRVSWFENLGGLRFNEHPLLENPGGLRSVVTDLDGDGLPDLLILMAQAREGLYWFRNLGGGRFSNTPLLQFQPAFGSTYFELADFNGDGLPDVLATNGDNGEYASCFKRYHGIRIYLNDGHQGFKESWFFPLNGAFKAIARDFDGDGDLDVAAISYFPDYEHSPEESFVYLENKGGLQFEPHTLAEGTAGRWITLDAGDIDGDGDIDIVLGSFLDGPPSTPIPATVRKSWASRNVAALLLRNATKRK
ncbi:MAG TPA: VCBS repeat-containing protein [Candidatus Limnocylindria bacterium]|jgi:hypothetical protein|nr:VCBS repeat-containing protein [Candidatus Limnocylindria bacterium]